MTELTVHVDKKQLEEVAAKRIAELERKLDLAEKREKRAKDRVKELEGTIENVTTAKQMLEQLTWDLDDLFDTIPKDYA